MILRPPGSGAVEPRASAPLQLNSTSSVWQSRWVGITGGWVGPTLSNSWFNFLVCSVGSSTSEMKIEVTHSDKVPCGDSAVLKKFWKFLKKHFSSEFVFEWGVGQDVNKSKTLGSIVKHNFTVLKRAYVAIMMVRFRSHFHAILIDNSNTFVRITSTTRNIMSHSAGVISATKKSSDESSASQISWNAKLYSNVMLHKHIGDDPISWFCPNWLTVQKVKWYSICNCWIIHSLPQLSTSFSFFPFLVGLSSWDSQIK